MIFQNLIAQIKTESRVKSDDNFDTVVIGLLNEIFKEAVISQRPFELRKKIQLTFTTTGIATVTLPTDFFLHHEVVFKDIDTGKQWQLQDTDKAVEPAPRGFYGHPKAFEIRGTDLDVSPSGVVQNDSLFLEYYKTPPVIENTPLALAVENPISRLEPFLIRACIRRLRMLHIDDPQVAEMFKQDMNSAAQGYAKDEPQAPPDNGSR